MRFARPPERSSRNPHEVWCDARCRDRDPRPQAACDLRSGASLMHTGCCMSEPSGGTGRGMRGVALVWVVLAPPAFAEDEPAPQPSPGPPPAADPNAAKLRGLEHRLYLLEHPPKPVEPP